jgi:hypothetical protein
MVFIIADPTEPVKKTAVGGRKQTAAAPKSKEKHGKVHSMFIAFRQRVYYNIKV